MQISLKMNNSKGHSMIQGAIVYPIISLALVGMIYIVIGLFFETQYTLNGLSEHERILHESTGVANYEEKKNNEQSLYQSNWANEISVYPKQITQSEVFGEIFVLFGQNKSFKHDYYYESTVVDEATYIQKIDMIVEGSFELIESIKNN